MAAPFYGMIKEVRVMLVDNDKEFVNEMVDLLKSYDYKVTTIDMASVAKAMSMLSKGKEKIDVMIINDNSPDFPSFQILAQAVALDIVSLFSRNDAVVCDEHNTLSAKKVLNDGAYLCLKKPIHEEIVKYLWQFVLRKKIQREKVRKGLEENGDQINIGDTNDVGNNDNIVGDEEQVGQENLSNTEELNNNIHEAENNVVSNEKYKLKRKRGRKSTKEINEGESQNSANRAVRRKVYIEWTVDLHAKFMEAVQLLGEGGCYPKDILEVMNVPGLTRIQVASHLQKCRSNNWKAPKERKFIRHPSGQEFTSGSQPRSNLRKFGAMPHLQTNLSNIQQQQCNPDQTQKGPKFLFPALNNNVFVRGESSTQQQLYRPQLQVQPHYLSINSSFNNSFFSAQNNVGGEIQQQHGALFGMLSSQGLQHPIIGSTNYWLGLKSNSGDHHTQIGSLDLNVAHVTTYSEDTLVSDTDIGNATINELGEAKANFQQYIGEPNMSNPSNIIAASHVSDTEGSDSNERENCDAYFDFDNMDNLFQNLGPPSPNLPNEYGSEFDQVYSDDQVAVTPSIQVSGIAIFF
ncbi:putative two-component response regulator ARR20 [Lycium barbarum]|uniref:putative two-component response regulator ARR20 n=1 Tax=Lycium barbarum TaxID=112863 RepID=UPI00293F59F3|nr:putative two-component response regulator ARR20 [Lycium barbarum]